jgi:hypothetical protein
MLAFLLDRNPYTTKRLSHDLLLPRMVHNQTASQGTAPFVTQTPGLASQKGHNAPVLIHNTPRGQPFDHIAVFSYAAMAILDSVMV